MKCVGCDREFKELNELELCDDCMDESSEFDIMEEEPEEEE